MQLKLLNTTSCLSIYYDSYHNWLFLDWAGNLTLSAVQDAGIAVAQCYLQHTYTQVLSSNLQVTSSSEHVATWLGIEFLPYLAMTGVKHVASISAPSLLSRHLGQTIRQWVPGLVLNFFSTTEEAIAWLQQTHLLQAESYLLSQQQVATQVQLVQGMQPLQQQMQLRRQKVTRHLSSTRLVNRL
jgi:hypothetical protein